MPRPGFVYILASKPNGTLYIGSTTDLARRLDQHRRGEGSAFVTEHGVTRLVYAEEHASPRETVERERRIKKWNREWKLRLIQDQNPTRRDLGVDLEVGPWGGSVAASQRDGESGDLEDGRMGPRLRGDDSVGGSSARASTSRAKATLSTLDLDPISRAYSSPNPQPPIPRTHPALEVGRAALAV
ncbi:GIY-YIG nuclease family protein, partial [Rubrivirga sp.]|uniref:GIY-YIG nuclease family protein n=1 Tax=Rubrivirga sp. TaxID=1885344 RepID=UPI003C71EBE7